MDKDYNVENWTVEYAKNFNKRLVAVGMPPFIIDEERKMLYKDLLHQVLDIGIQLK